MAGFSNDENLKEIVYADNVDFSGGTIPAAQVTTDGQLLIGATAYPNIRVGALGSSDGSITWTVGAGTITGQVSGGTTVGKTITGNSGGPISPSSGNWNLTGTGSITVVGAGSTLTPQLTGLTNNSIMYGLGTATVGLVTPANDGVLITGDTGTPTLLANGTTGQLLTATTGSTPSWQNAPSSSITINPDSGAALTGTSFNIFGYQAGTVPVMETYNDGSGNFRIADQSYVTQYVVDPSTTPGLEGTFTTIQGAINQAVTDGYTVSTLAKIIVRTGSYNENVVVPTNFCGIIEGPVSGNNDNIQFSLGAQLQGSFTTGTGSSITLKNLFLNPSGIDAVDSVYISSGTTNFLMQECYVGAGSNSSINSLVNSGNVIIQNSLIVGLSIFNASTGYISAPDMITGCTCYTFSIINNSAVSFVNTATSTITLGDGGSIIMQNCIPALFQTNQYSNNITGSSTNPCYLYNNVFFYYNPCIAATATFYCCNNSTTNGGALFSAPATIIDVPAQDGSIMIRVPQTGNYVGVYSDQYVPYTSTAGAYSYQLPVTGSTPGQRFWIKDESLAAATNNITITAEGGALIEGLSSAVINKNGGSFLFEFDGTNFFILTSYTGPAFNPFIWNDVGGPTISALANNGYFITGVTTATLPASPNLGDVIRFSVDTTSLLTITANTGQYLRFGTALSVSAGIAVNTQQGDSVELVYSDSSQSWVAQNYVGGWDLT